ncbi:MAG: DUF4345 domain-containing protein [bacterium]|nr:DUF4345 domain-containing protein [bacterium]
MIAAVGLTPIALSYGLMPKMSLPWLFGINADAVNTRQIFRAIMGLYLALVAFWLIGALSPSLQVPALWSLVVFMIGLALGRLVSLLLDGWPHPLLFIYMILELAFALIGWLLLHRANLT